MGKVAGKDQIDRLTSSTSIIERNDNVAIAHCQLVKSRGFCNFLQAPSHLPLRGCHLLRLPLFAAVWDSPDSTDTFTLREAGLLYSILLEVDGPPVIAQS